jgi:ATP-dependent Lon protease
VGIPIDASQVSWIATANQPELIEPALRTRLKIIEVRLPTPAQARLIAHHVYADLRRAAPWGTSFSVELPEAVAEALSEDSPRDQRLRLEGAFARAARAQRDVLQVADLPARPSEAIAAAEASQSRYYDQARVGFTVPLAARKSAAAA